MAKISSLLSLPLFLFGGALFAGPAMQRVPLITISVEGYEPLADKRLHLDAGVREVGDACELLEPRPGSRAAQQPWTPLDFYGNRSEDSAPAETDLYFAGDNRENTAEPDPYLLDSLDFEQPRRAKDWASFYLGFTRGSLVFHGLVGVRAFRDGDHCTAAAYLCTQPIEGEHGTANCAETGWTKRVTAVIANADTVGGFGDRFRRIHRDRERHDIGSLDVVVTDANGTRREELVHK